MSLKIELGNFLLNIDERSLLQSDLMTLDEVVVPFQAEMKGLYSSVTISGMLSRGDLLDLLSACEKLEADVTANVRWEIYDPALLITMEGEKTGQIELECDATMDPLTEQHKFIMRIDQTYIGQAVQSIRAALRR